MEYEGELGMLPVPRMQISPRSGFGGWGEPQKFYRPTECKQDLEAGGRRVFWKGFSCRL